MVPEVRRLFDRAAIMSQTERRDLVSSKDRKHPTEYTRPCKEATDIPITMAATRRQDIMDSLTNLLQSLYGIPPQKVQIEWGISNRSPATAGRMSALYGQTGKSLFDADQQYNSPISIDYCVRLLWWETVWELEDASVTMKKGHDEAKVHLRERMTHSLDENNQLHREDGAAIIDPNGDKRGQYYWHGDHVDANLFTNPKGADLRQVTREPGFSLIGGWAGLAQHEASTLIAQKGYATLMECGGSKTWYYEQALRRDGAKDYKGRKYHTKPDRFLYDPSGISGWVSKEVRTIPGAQRSLLRKKLTQYNSGRK